MNLITRNWFERIRLKMKEPSMKKNITKDEKEKGRRVVEKKKKKKKEKEELFFPSGKVLKQ